MYFILAFLIVFIGIAAIGVFIANAGKFKFILSSRPVTAILVLYLWLSFPDYYKTWVDGYEDRSGYHDVYDTTYTDDPSRFDVIFQDHSDTAYVILNSFLLLFVAYVYYLVRYSYSLDKWFGVEMDIVGLVSFPALFLFNPFDPLIKFLPPDWIILIKGFYIICLIIWFMVYNDTKRSYKLKKKAAQAAHERLNV